MIRILINIYIVLIVVNVIIQYIPNYRDLDWAKKLKKIVDFSCVPVKKYIPSHNIPFDFSPVLVILGLILIKIIW